MRGELSPDKGGWGVLAQSRTPSKGGYRGSITGRRQETVDLPDDVIPL